MWIFFLYILKNLTLNWLCNRKYPQSVIIKCLVYFFFIWQLKLFVKYLFGFLFFSLALFDMHNDHSVNIMVDYSFYQSFFNVYVYTIHIISMRIFILNNFNCKNKFVSYILKSIITLIIIIYI